MDDITLDDIYDLVDLDKDLNKWIESKKDACQPDAMTRVLLTKACVIAYTHALKPKEAKQFLMETFSVSLALVDKLISKEDGDE